MIDPFCRAVLRRIVWHDSLAWGSNLARAMLALEHAGYVRMGVATPAGVAFAHAHPTD